MESNIKGLVAAGHEMASELKAECGAVDMRSVAKLISDLATQLEVQLVRANALAEDQQKAIESIKQADSAVKLAHEKFSVLAAENAGLKHAMTAPIEHENVEIEQKAGRPRFKLKGKDRLIADLRKQRAEWIRKALRYSEERAALAKRIEEMEQANAGQDANINSQQERVTQSANRHVYHYNAVGDVGGIAMSGIAQLPFRIKSQSDLEEFKSALSKVCGFHANAITSLSYLGREEDEQNDEKP